MRFRNVGILAAAVAGLLASASGAMASAVLSISDGTSTFVIPDGNAVVGLVDAAPSAGQISWTGTVGGFSLAVSTGSSKNVDGSAASPAGHLNISATGLGTLFVAYSDDSYTAVQPMGIVAFIGGANFIGSSSYSVISGPGNSTEILYPLAPAGTTIVGPLGLVGITGTTGSGVLPATQPYSLTQYVVITNSSSGTSSIDAGFNSVPVPAAAWMGLSTLAGLAGLGVIRRRRLA